MRKAVLTATHNGRTQTLKRWSRETGISYHTLYNRVVVHGVPVDAALSQKPIPKRMRISAFGEEKTIYEWAADSRCVVTFAGLQGRLRTGMDPEKAITTPRAKPKYDIQPGQRFGMLVAVESGRIETSGSGHKKTIVKCRCDCGTVCDKPGLYLKHGDNPHCGCCNKPKGRKATRTKEEKAEVQKRWSIRNRAMRKMYIREWKLRNPGRVAAYRAARRLAEVIEWSEADKAAVAAIYDLSSSDAVIPCYLCGCETRRGGRHVDHRKALAKGGSHTADNLGIACTDCNLSKSTKSVEECR